jgi:hypothetical protein
MLENIPPSLRKRLARVSRENKQPRSVTNIRVRDETMIFGKDWKVLTWFCYSSLTRRGLNVVKQFQNRKLSWRGYGTWYHTVTTRFLDWLELDHGLFGENFSLWRELTRVLSIFH